MVPIPVSSFDPALDKCLNGDELLISWRTAFYAILDPKESEITEDTAIYKFFSDQRVQDLLSLPFIAFPEPSPQSKTEFEAKTSPINVTPSSNTRYGIKEVKEDVLWLSKEAKIDEISALRVVVEECQTRTSAKLRDRLTTEELTGMQDAGGHSQFTVPVPLLSQVADADLVEKDFETLESRRLRILRTYYSERQFILKVVSHLLQRHINRRLRTTTKGKGKGAEPSSILERVSEGLFRQMTESEEWLHRCITAIGINVQNIDNSKDFFKESSLQADIELEWINAQIVEATQTMEITFLIIDLIGSIISSTAVLEWFRLVVGRKFFQLDSEEPSIQISVSHLQSITATISVAILGVSSCVDYLANLVPVLLSEDDQHAYIAKAATIHSLHDMFVTLASEQVLVSSPSILAWGVILQAMRLRVRNFGAFQENNSDDASAASQPALLLDVYQEVIDRICSDQTEDIVRQLVVIAVDESNVFEILGDLAARFGNTSNAHFSPLLGASMRMNILDLLRNCDDVGYIPELVSAALSTLTGGQTYWDSVDALPSKEEHDLALAFLRDQEIKNNLLIPARARYPFESLPFLKLVRALAASTSCHDRGSMSIISCLEPIPTFTQILPDGFMAYETTQEEDNNNSIRLTRPVELFEPRSRMTRGLQGTLSLIKVDPDFCIPQGTYGRMVSESNPKVAYWFHEYSGLKYFGKLLETFLAAGDQVDATTGDIADRDSVTEIITIFAVLLLSLSRTADSLEWKEEAIRILELASSGMSRNRDITSVVFDIFQEELQRQSTNSGSEAPLELLVSCVQFVHSLILITPARVWPLLNRCGLLDLDPSGGKLSSIVGSVELVSGRYDLLISCTRLYQALIDDFVKNAVVRRCKVKTPTRFEMGEGQGAGVPDQILSRVVLGFTRYLVDVLESSCTWKFFNLDDCRRLRKNITRTFDTVLRSTFGLDNSSSDDSEASQKMISSKASIKPITAPKIATPTMMAVFEAAALHITDSFLSTSTGSLRVQPLLRIFYDGLGAIDSDASFYESRLGVAQVESGLSFTKTLLNVGTLLGRPTSQLQSQLFKASPLIARLFAANDAYHIPVVALFESLVLNASNNSTDPSSLLGHLGPRTSRNFLHILSDLDKPLSRNEHFISIMHFFSKVVSSRQQWFANYLLTGRTSRGTLTSKAGVKELAILDKPPLSTALDSFSDITTMRKSEALERLKFITLAQNHWPWATSDSKKHADFIQSISEYVGKLIPLQPSTIVEVSIDSAYQTRIAAYIAEIIAMHLFHSRQTGRSAITKDLLENLSYFTRFAVALPRYNSSLHANFKANFERHFTGCKLMDFQRTSLEPSHLGRDYFYDLTLANKMLSFDPAWNRPDGYLNEFVNANVNLSLVDSQVALLHGWKFLAIEISTDLSSPDLQKTLTKVASDCLESNKKSQGSEEVFVRLCQTRADLALVLIQRLIEANPKAPELEALLALTWETIRSSNITFEIALGSGDPAYYRSLLKVLFLSLRVHSDGNKQNQNAQADFRASTRLTQSSTIIPTVLDILDRVVAKGLRDLAAFIHEKPAEASPDDLGLITGVLQACLHVPGIEFCYSQIVSMFVQNDSPRLATTLFSWADTLAIGGDPIYGELSILFLVELSTVPAMAEQLGVDGVLSQIGTANITSYLRQGKVSPFADGTGVQRCYRIWAKGILPLVLNLLDAVGASIAAEVAIFLNQFPALLKQSSEAFDAPETSRTITKADPKYIAFNVCSEVHVTSLIMFILNGFRDGSTGEEIPEVTWDAAAVLENVEFWLGSRPILRERILPMGEREVALSKKTVVSEDTKNKLEDKVVLELMGIRDVLGAQS